VINNKDQQLEKAEQDKEQEREAKEQALLAQEKAERKALNVQKFMNRITVRENKMDLYWHDTPILFNKDKQGRNVSWYQIY